MNEFQNLIRLRLAVIVLCLGVTLLSVINDYGKIGFVADIAMLIYIIHQLKQFLDENKY